ncbi:MAG TPA: hypothetical protein VN673_02325 [Clostridia bacterium]|nr:hypothetical protein [Clostridia bacterium]
MAENIPSIPGGAVPPKKETGKVQPKKETVRINLPPKPSAAPTIKLPTLPPGGPAGPGAGAPAPALSTAASAAPSRAAAAPAAVGRQASSPPTASRPAMAPATVIASVSPLDKGLAIAAAVVGLVAVASSAYLIWVLPH